MSLDGILAGLDGFRDEHARLGESERHAQSGIRRLRADNDQLRARVEVLQDAESDAVALRQRVVSLEREVEAVTVERDALKAKPVELRDLKSQVRALRSDLELARREIRTVTNNRDALRSRLTEALAAVRQTADLEQTAHATALQQARRQLAATQDLNSRLSVQVAELKDQLRQADARAESAKRAMLEHAGRT